MSNCNGNPENCGKCKPRTGLPIFLTRYAVAPKAFDLGAKTDVAEDAKAPVVSIDNVSKYPSLIDIADHAYYTQRILRSGYIYMYDEARNTWKAYYINSDGCLTQFPFPKADWNKAAATDADEGPPCRAANYGVASAIYVDDPENATNVWIAYSGVEWTKKVFTSHKLSLEIDNGVNYAENHMRKFDVKKWISSREHDHVMKITELEETVADYKKDVNRSAFNYASLSLSIAFVVLNQNTFKEGTPPPPEDLSISYYNKLEDNQRSEVHAYIARNSKNMISSPFKDSAYMIKDTFERINPGMGAIIALDDPVGIATELVALIGHRERLFQGKLEYRRKLAAAARIASLQSRIYAAAESKAVKNNHAAANLYIRNVAREKYPSRYPTILRDIRDQKEPASKYFNKKELEEFSAKFCVSEELFKKQQEKEWEKFRNAYSQTKVKEFEDEYNAKYGDYRDNSILPLAQAHAGWMQSFEMNAYFMCNYDSENVTNGGVYAAEVFSCIDSTQTLQPCNELYAKWLSTPASTPGNLLMKAVCLNMKEWVEKDLVSNAEKITEIINKAKSAPMPNEDDALKGADMMIQVGAVFSEEMMDGASSFYAKIDNALKIIGSPSENGWFQAQMARISASAVKLISNPSVVCSELLAITGAIEDKFAIPLRVNGRGEQMLLSAGRVLGNKLLQEEVFARRVQGLLNLDGGGVKMPKDSVFFILLRRNEMTELIGYMNNPASCSPQQVQKLAAMVSSRMFLDTHPQFKARVNNGAILFGIRTPVNEVMRRITDGAEALKNRTMNAMQALSNTINIVSLGTLVFTWSGLVAARRELLSNHTTEWKKFEAATRFTVGIAGGASTITSAIEAAASLEKVQKRFPLARSFTTRYGGAIRIFGRFTGVVTGFVMAFWDANDAFKSFREGNWIMGTLYAASAIVGGISIILLIIGAAFTPIGLVVLGIALLFSILISVFKPDPFERWLNLCIFAKTKQEGSFTEYEEIREWNLAMEGVKNG